MANKPISTSPTTMGKHGRLREEEAARDKGVKFGEIKAEADKTPSADALARNADDQAKAKEAPKPTTHGLPSAPADVKPAAARQQLHGPLDNSLPNQGMPRNLAATEIMPAKTPEPDGPMSLADVNAILADTYPGFEPANVRGESAGLKFALPGGKSITVERAKIKKCANMEELRAYIDSVK